MKKRILTLLLAASMTLGLTACGGSTPPPASSSTPSQGGSPSAPAEKKEDLIVSMTRVGNNLDSSIANDTNITIITSHIYDWILAVDEKFEFEAAVVKSWEYTDNTTFKMTIGEGYKFHNGEALELDDIIYSIERNRAVPKRAATMENIASVTATGTNEVTIKLAEPDISTIRTLMGFAQVFDKSYCESVGEAYANAPIGTGPYTVKSYVPGDKIELTRWEDYPFEKSPLKSITFKGIEENANRYISLETGEAQFATIAYQDLARAQGNDKLNVQNVKTTNTAFISMNNKKAPFDNKNVRMAMAYACDKDGLAVVEGGADVIDSLTPPMFNTYYASPNMPKYDLEKAKSLLEAEGYTAANPLKFETWVYGGKTKVMEAYQAILKSIGVEMSIKNLEFGVFLEGMAKGEYQMLGGSWNNTTGDPLTALENYSTSSFGVQNISFYESTKADELYNKAKTATDENDLQAISKEMQELVAADMPIIPTYSISATFAMTKELQGVRIYGSSLYSFRNAHFA